MRMEVMEVTDEYLDELCEAMMSWVQRDDARTVPQFLQCNGIGYPIFKYFIYRSPKVKNTFEVMKSILCNRWLHMALHKKNISPYLGKVLMRYIRLYDAHAYDMEQESKAVIADIELRSEFMTENYAKEKLDGFHREQYEKNVDKGRDSEKVK